ncbi:uncharacterized protein CBL_05806 [Carabus blaptoides fortunei]
MKSEGVFSKPDTLLKSPLTLKQQSYWNYIVPVTLTTLIYILNFAADLCLVVQHNRDEQYFFAYITLAWIYLPVLGSFFLTMSNVDIWPEEQGFGRANLRWLCIKVLQHMFFPIWAMYRFAEQLFWSIETVRSTNEYEIGELMHNAE